MILQVASPGFARYPKQRNAYRGRRKALPDEKAANRRRRAGEKKARLAREFGRSRETLYQYLRQEPVERERGAPAAESLAMFGPA